MRRAALVAALALAGVAAAPALAHEGNPDYESLVTEVEGLEGVTAQVVNGDDRLLLINDTGEELVVEGYDDEPYARLRPGGVVEVNERSSATYLNEDRFGDVDVPASVDPEAEPQWRQVAQNGRFEFHDHRIHWMLEDDPPQVEDRSQRTKIMDWEVPLRAGSTAGSVRGTLFWRGEDGGGVSPALIAGGAALVLGSLLFLVIMRRRRSEAGATPSAGTPTKRDAW